VTGEIPGEHRAADIDAFLALYPAHIVRQVEKLRALVARAVPGASERLRPGWRLIAYDLPASRQGTYFAYVAPEVGHVHLGFAWGTLMSDPTSLLEGAHLGLRRVRYLTFQPTQRIEARPALALLREAARVAAMHRGERQLLALARTGAS